MVIFRSSPALHFSHVRSSDLVRPLQRFRHASQHHQREKAWRHCRHERSLEAERVRGQPGGERAQRHAEVAGEAEYANRGPR